MASSWACHRRNSVPRPHGHERRDISYPTSTWPPCRHQEHLRAPCSWLLWPDCFSHVFAHIGNVILTICGPVGCSIHGNYARLHLEICCRQLRQRSYRHFPPCLHILSLDQSCQKWFDNVGSAVSSLLRLYGFCLGRIRFHH